MAVLIRVFHLAQLKCHIGLSHHPRLLEFYQRFSGYTFMMKCCTELRCGRKTSREHAYYLKKKKKLKYEICPCIYRYVVENVSSLNTRLSYLWGSHGGMWSKESLKAMNQTPSNRINKIAGLKPLIHFLMSVSLPLCRKAGCFFFLLFSRSIRWKWQICKKQQEDVA